MALHTVGSQRANNKQYYFMGPYKPISEFSHNGTPLQLILDSHKRLIRKGDGEKADLSGADLIKADLGRADLMWAELSEAQLSKANLSEARLVGAELSGANLSGADLIKADLSRANLRSANLSNADLCRSILIGTNLTGAELSGICLDEANLKGWIIKGVKCSDMIRGESREVVRFKPLEFEKKYTQLEKLSELILNVPHTESAYHIGKFIAQSINDVMGTFIIDLKGVEALSNYDTKFVFIIYDEAFFKEKRVILETKAKDALNEFFTHKPIEKDEGHFNDVVEEATGRTIRLRTSIPIPFTPLEADPKEIQNKLVEYYIKLGKIGESIREIMFSIFG